MISHKPKPNRAMYFELKAFESGKKTKLQLDANPPFTNDASPIIGKPNDAAAPQFDAKRVRTLLLHVANELIPRLVAKHYSSKEKNGPNDLLKLVQKYADCKDPDSDEAKAFVSQVIKFIDKSKGPLLINTTRFNYENVDTRFTQDTRTVVNGDIPPPSRPPKTS